MAASAESPGDREQFSSYEDNLKGELQEYLSEHSRREDYALLSPVRVLMETDSDLDVGEFGIATRMVQPERRRAASGEPEGDVAPGATMIYKPKTPVATQAVSGEPIRACSAWTPINWNRSSWSVWWPRSESSSV